jgi:hypothetical protein
MKYALAVAVIAAITGGMIAIGTSIQPAHAACAIQLTDPNTGERPITIPCYVLSLIPQLQPSPPPCICPVLNLSQLHGPILITPSGGSVIISPVNATTIGMAKALTNATGIIGMR